MEKITRLIAIAALMPILAMAQHTDHKNPYLVQPPYEGLHGQIDSVVLITYLVKDSISTKALLETKLDKEKLNLMKGEVSERTSIIFDANGYFTKRREESKSGEHNLLEINTKWEVARDEQSLPTHIIFRTPTDGTVTDFKLVSRENGKEIYSTPRNKGNIPSIATQVEQIVEFEGDTITTTRIYPTGYQTRYTYIYDAEGRNIYWTDKMDGEDNFVEVFSTYNEDGLLSQIEHKDFNINTQKEDLQSDTFIKYRHYQFEDKKEGHSANWIHRVLLNENDSVVAIEEQKIYYRKK